MKHPLLFFLVLLLCVAPVVGLSVNFQDSGDYISHINISALSVDYTITYPCSPTGGNCYINIATVSGLDYLTNKDPLVSDYAAATVVSTTFDRVYINLMDASQKSIYVYTYGGGYGYPQRFEVKMVGGQANIYRNGALIATSGVLSLNPSYVGFAPAPGASFGIDDFVYGGSENRYIFGSPTQGYRIIKDFTNPAASGFYNSAGALVSSTNFTTTYGFGDSNASQTVIFQNSGSATTVGSFATTAGSMSGLKAWPMNDVIINNPLAEYGLYVTTISGSGKTSGVLPYMGGGATVTFDKDVYAVGDSGSIVTYVAGGAYWDPVTYDYALEVQDIYGTVKQSTTITSASGTVPITWNDADSLGVWYAVLKATPKAGGTTIWMNYDWCELQAYIIFSGYVMNAENGAVLPNAYVNVTQANVTLQSQSLASGAWNSSNSWVGGSSFNITTMKTGYTTDVRLFSPLASKSIFLNISLVPLPPANVSVSVGGIVRDNVYGNPIQNATVSGVNNTLTRTNLTNIAGYYRVDGMKNPDVVNMSAAKSGCMNDTVSGFEDAAISSSFTRKDLVLDPVFSLTVNIIDSSTHMPIPVVTVLDSLGNNQTTTVGQYIESYPYSPVVLYLSSAGYVSKSVSYIMDSDSSDIVEMTKTIEVAAGAKLNVLYPHEVQFTLVDTQGAALPDVSVAVVMTNSTVENTNWFLTLFGITSETTPVDTTTLTGTSDDGGQIAFPLISSGKYTMSFYSVAKGISETKTVYPQQANYIFTLHPSASLIPNMADYINGTLYVTQPNASFVNFNLSYLDKSHKTNSVTFYVNFANTTRYYTAVTTGQYLANASKTVKNEKAAGYVFGYYANTSMFGNITASQGITLQGVTGRLMDLDPCGGYALGWDNTC